MLKTDLPIYGAFSITSDSMPDSRGYFREWFWKSECEFDVAQGNLSYSNINVIRGLHVSVAPAGQAKWITCVAGSIRDVLFDLRPNSPTFLQVFSLDISSTAGITISIPTGVAHGFCSLMDGSVVTYLVSARYDYDNEIGIYPLDPEIGISWGTLQPILSDKDHGALKLSEFRAKFESNMGNYLGN